MPLEEAYPFGLRDVKLKPITNPTTEALGAAVDLPTSRTLSFTEAEEYEKLRGDDKTKITRGKGAEVQWELENGGISLDAYKVINGGTITDSGVTPNQKRVYKKKVTDKRPYFRAEGQSMGEGDGDLHIILYRCMATGDIEGEFADGQFWVTKCSGDALPSREAANIDALYDFVQNETAADIV